MNVGLQFNSAREGRRFEEERGGKKEKGRGEVGMLIFLAKECKIWDSVG